jgi:hypothetical protein
MGLKNRLVVPAKEKRPLPTGVFLIGNPLDFVAVLRVSDSVAIGADLSWLYGISHLRLRSPPSGHKRMRPKEVPIQFFNLGHEVCIEASNLDAGLAKAPLTSAADLFIGVEGTDDDSTDTSVNDALDTGPLRVVSRSARLQSREQCCARQRSISEFALQKCELGVLTGR